VNARAAANLGLAQKLDKRFNDCIGSNFHAAIDHTPKERAGIGSAVLNASRQVGGVIGIALLGALISSHARRGATAHFMVGLHEGLALSGLLFLAGSALSLAFVERG
jgi:DHA2 family methylenomycin A resistance protein-like MFS transporter